MNALHPATAPILAVLSLVGRVALDAVSPAAGEAWQRGIEVLAAGVTVAVFLRFSAGDPPRWPWAMMMGTLVTVVVARVGAAFGVTIGDAKLAHLLFIGSNILMTVGMIGFTRVLGSSELLSERSEQDRWRALAVVGLLALGAIAALTFNTFGVAEQGWPVGAGRWVAAISSFVSTLSDALVCAGGIYLVWLVRPLLGGSLARPYLLLAISAGGFLIVDFLLVAAGATIQTELSQQNTSATLARWLGCLSYALVGLSAATQWWLLVSAGRRAARAAKTG